MKNSTVTKIIIPAILLLGICTVILDNVLSVQNTTTLAAESPLSMNLWIEGIEGESTIAGREDSIEVFSYSHSIKVLYDTSTRVTGNIVHTPFRIVKSIDKATPKLYDYMDKGMVITSVIFRVYAEPGSLNFLTIELTNAVVISMSDYATVSTESTPYATEIVSFIYERVKWTYTEFDETGSPKGYIEYQAWWGGGVPD